MFAVQEYARVAACRARGSVAGGSTSEAPVKLAIGYIKTKEFRDESQKLADSAWERVYDKNGRLDYEVAEVPFVSNTEALIESEPYRHIVVRRKAKQGILPGLGTNDNEIAEPDGRDVWAGLPCACNHL